MPNALSSYNRIVTITKSDTVAIPSIPNAIMCITAGNLVFVNADGTTCTLTGAVAGQVYPIRPIRINSASTTGVAAALYI